MWPSDCSPQKYFRISVDAQSCAHLFSPSPLDGGGVGERVNRSQRRLRRRSPLRARCARRPLPQGERWALRLDANQEMLFAGRLCSFDTISATLVPPKPAENDRAWSTRCLSTGVLAT